jgi:hypothetical protein
LRNPKHSSFAFTPATKSALVHYFTLVLLLELVLVLVLVLGLVLVLIFDVAITSPTAIIIIIIIIIIISIISIIIINLPIVFILLLRSPLPLPVVPDLLPRGVVAEVQEFVPVLHPPAPQYHFADHAHGSRGAGQSQNQRNRVALFSQHSVQSLVEPGGAAVRKLPPVDLPLRRLILPVRRLQPRRVAGQLD